MRSPAPNAGRIASMTVSTAVAALALGIWARSTTRSTMSALITVPPRLARLYNLLFLQSDGGGQRGRGGARQLPDEGQVGRRGALRRSAFHVEKCHRLLTHQDRLDQALHRPAAQGLGQILVARQGRAPPHE